MHLNLDNRFFQSALQKAARILGKPGRLVLLLLTFGRKINRTKFTKEDSVIVKDKFYTLARLLRAYTRGEYRTIPWKSLLLIVAALVYFINPVDIIPDLMPVVGFTDDFAVLYLVYKSVGEDIEKFLLWEKSKTTIIS